MVATEINDLPLPETRSDRPAGKQEDRLAGTMLFVVQRHAIGQLKVGHCYAECLAKMSSFRLLNS